MQQAFARWGEASAAPPGAKTQRLEVRHLFESLAEGLGPVDRQAFLALPTDLATAIAPPPLVVPPELTADPAARLAHAMQDFTRHAEAQAHSLHSATRQLEALSALAHRLQGARDLEDACRHIHEVLREAFSAERVLLLTLEEDALQGLSIHDIGAFEVAWVQDARHAPQWLQAEGAVTLLAVPLPMGDRNGVLYLESKTGSEADLSLLTSLALHAGATLALPLRLQSLYRK